MDWKLIDLASLEKDGLTYLITLILGGVGGYLTRKFKIKSPVKRLWKINDASTLTICVAESKPVDVLIGGKVDPRATTGIGQVKSLGVIVESMSKAYNLNMENIHFSNDKLDNKIEKDIIILGGHNTNKVAKAFFQQIKNLNIVEADGNDYLWKRNGSTRYTDIHHSDGSRTEYGLIVRTPNPFKKNSKSMLTLFAGCHTVGTIAAAKYFTETYLKKYNNWNFLDLNSTRTVYMIVECIIRQGETYPNSIEMREIHEC